jgi:FkbM family methyltransferase
MKDKVIINQGIDNKEWYWPSKDNGSWVGQHASIDLVNHIMPFVRDTKVMVQAGGNCGLILSTFLDRFETIYTFEPDPINFYCLNLNVTDEKVIKLQTCLGYERNTVDVKHLSEGNCDIGGSHVSGEGKIPMITIDSLNLSACDLIQLDIEGYEYEALLGAKSTIEKYKPVLCVEFYEPWSLRYGHTSAKIFELIESLGYKLAANYTSDVIFISA